MEITINEARKNLFNKIFLKLLVQDYQMGMALDEEQNGFFGLPLEEQAKRISRHIQNNLDEALYDNVLSILKEDKQMFGEQMKWKGWKDIKAWAEKKGFKHLVARMQLNNDAWMSSGEFGRSQKAICDNLSFGADLFF